MRRDGQAPVTHRPIFYLALVCTVLACALSLYRLARLPDAPRSGVITGVVRETDGTRVLLESVCIEGAGDEREALGGRVLMDCAPYSYPVQAGTRIRAQAALSPLKGPQNPYGWDERTHWITDDVIYTAQGEILSHTDPAFVSPLQPLRAAFRAQIDALWDSEDAPVIAALLLGAKDDLSDETYEAFRRSGAAHLLAVSGLHVGFVMALFALLLCRMPRASYLRAGLILAGMVGYALLAQSAFSVFRATVMLAFALFAPCVGRRADGLTALSIAVILALALRPAEVLRTGFQMSVCAVIGILMLSGRIESLLRRVVRVRFLYKSIALTLGAQLGVLPVELFTFHTLPTLSLLTNLASVPLCAGIVMLGLPTVLLGAIWTPLAAAPAFLCGLLCRMLTLLCETVSGVSFALISLKSPPILVLIGFMLLLLVCSPFFLQLHKRLRRPVLIAVLCTLALSLALWLPGLFERKTEAVFLSVGTADSALLRSPSGNLLIDTGWTGTQAVRAIRGDGLRLDAVILTHKDSDHAGGLAHLIKNAPVGAVYIPLGMPRTELEAALDSAQAADIPVLTLKRGDNITVGDFTIRALWPDYVRIGQDNADSLVLSVTANGHCALFLSDITQETENRLGFPASDIVKLPHHGSATGTTARMLRQSAPQAAVLSVGTPNRYGFPAPDVLERLSAQNIPVYRTDLSGALIADLGADGFSIRPYAPPSLLTLWTGLGS